MGEEFLPTTANRLVFLITVLFIVGSGISQGIDSLRHGEKGLGYFSLAMYGLCVLNCGVSSIVGGSTKQ